MSLHIDVFFYKEGSVVKKAVYMTSLFRCDQGLEDSLDLATAVLKQITCDLPNIVNIYGKSDNASHYMGNFVLEALFNLCKQHGKKLVRYDYNEPCKGKDQCDREASYAKGLLCSYVHAGNNIDSASDVAQSLKHAGGLKNTKVAVAVVDSSANRLITPPKSEVTGIKSYHSYVFHKTYMVAWKYYNIGKGVKLNYVGVQYKPSIKLLEEFTPCHQQGWSPAPQLSKNRESRMPNLLYFCPESNCSQVFEQLENIPSRGA